MANDCARGNSIEETTLLQALLATKKKAEHDRLWAALVQRYERLIISCVVKKLRQYDAARGFRIASFLGLVATNATIDHLRARQADATPLDEVIEDYASLRAEAPRDAVEAREEAELARAALAQLSGEERAFVVDCFRDERSPEELARSLGVTTNTVYSRKFKIREKLQKIVRTLD